MSSHQSDILLCTINASYIHAAIGLRYLYANLGRLRKSASIKEFTCHLRPADIVENLLSYNPRIIGFGIYIWNVEHTTKVIQLIKILAPDIKIVIGGPEVSFEYDQQTIYSLADHLITGAADTSFAQLCFLLLEKKQSVDTSPAKVFIHPEPPLQELELPYSYYSDEDLKNRVIYVEASRGCPFKCEFCLSALDKTSIEFELDNFLFEMDKLYTRGARNFKFVDRTFNLKTETSLKILNFFLQRIDENLHLHFEIIPDRLPAQLKAIISQFPPGSLQFEIGIQTFNPQVQSLISRKQNNERTIANMQWLVNQSHAHIHADLIFGLPGEDLVSFGHGFNLLYSLSPDDIQVGILKRLRGTPVIRHTEHFNLCFDKNTPYSILATDRVSFTELQRLGRFARYWELMANSGHFKLTLNLLLSDDAFNRFLIFSDWLYDYLGKTHQISLRKLYDYLYYGFKNCFQNLDTNTTTDTEIIAALMKDYQNAGLKGVPEFYKNL